MPDYLNRAQAAVYISDQLGISVSADSLAQRASKGTGPRYRIFGGLDCRGRGGYGRPALYTYDDLDAWIEAQLQPPTRRASNAVRAAAS